MKKLTKDELKVAEERKERKLQEINKARVRRKQTQIEKESGEINIEVTRKDIRKIEVGDLKRNNLNSLETKEGYYRGVD